MRDHIAKTIAEVQAAVDRGLQTIQLLKEFDAATEPHPEITLPCLPNDTRPTMVALPRNGHRRLKPKPHKPRQETKANQNGDAKVGDRVRAVIADMRGPFTKLDVHAALGDRSIAVRQVHFILVWERKMGRIAVHKQGRGATLSQYIVPAKQAKAQAQKPAPAARSARDELNEKLKAATAQRDAARDAGRDHIVEVYQSEIDKLLVQLGDLK